MGQCLINGKHWTLGYEIVSFLQFGLSVILFCSLFLWKKFDSSNNENKENYKNISLIELLKLPKAKCALIGFFCYCGLELSTGLWGASFMVLQKQVEPEIAAKWISLFYFGITFGRLLSGFITMKLSAKNMVRLGQFVLLCGIIIVVMPFSNLILPIGFFMIGLGCAPIYPSMLHSTPDNFGKDVSQSIMGKQMAAAYVGSTFMPPVVGFFVDNVTPKLFPIILFTVLIFMFLMTERLYKKNLSKEK